MTAKQFQEKGYTVVRNVLSKELCDFITQYAFFDEMQKESNADVQAPNAHSRYADPAMETVLATLTEKMESATGLKLHPTYSYYRIYGQGDDLEKHTDRNSCEISCTLCFNYSYDDKEYEWPIYMDGYRAVLKPGDMVVYRGIDLEHWRDEFDIDDEDAWHVQGFFHYVDVNGPNAEWKWDKRESLGILPVSNETQKVQMPSLPSYIEYTR